MQGTISFDGTLSGGITGGGGGGSEVTITPVLTEGTKIADYTIDGDSGSLYAPEAEALPSTIVTKALRKYNDTSQTKILTITTLDTENSQEVSQDIYAPSPVQCWYTPGLEQDYQIGQFTYGGVTQNVYIPYFQRPLTAGANITIDQDNVISATGGGSGWNYSTNEVNTGQKWIDGKDIYCKAIPVFITGTSTAISLPGVDTYIRTEGFLEYTGKQYTIPITSYYENTNYNCSTFYDYNNSSIIIVHTTGVSTYYPTGYLIAFYTKTD